MTPQLVHHDGLNGIALGPAIRIRLPWPAAALFPNRKGGQHWGKYHAAKISARATGFAAAKHAIGTCSPDLVGRVPVRIVFYMPDRRKRDWDGMAGSIKHHLDGVAKALGVDDSIFRPVIIDDDLDPEKRGYVLIEIERGVNGDRDS